VTIASDEVAIPTAHGRKPILKTPKLLDSETHANCILLRILVQSRIYKPCRSNTWPQIIRKVSRSARFSLFPLLAVLPPSPGPYPSGDLVQKVLESDQSQHNMAEFGITSEDGCPSVKAGRTSTKTLYRREPCFNMAVACSSTASVIRRPDSMRASSVARSRSVARYCTEVKVRPARSTFSTE
jgi:hypothetical protein